MLANRNAVEENANKVEVRNKTLKESGVLSIGTSIGNVEKESLSLVPLEAPHRDEASLIGTPLITPSIAVIANSASMKVLDSIVQPEEEDLDKDVKKTFKSGLDGYIGIEHYFRFGVQFTQLILVDQCNLAPDYFKCRPLSDVYVKFPLRQFAKNSRPASNATDLMPYDPIKKEDDNVKLLQKELLEEKIFLVKQPHQTDMLDLFARSTNIKETKVFLTEMFKLFKELDPVEAITSWEECRIAHQPSEFVIVGLVKYQHAASLEKAISEKAKCSQNGFAGCYWQRGRYGFAGCYWRQERLGHSALLVAIGDEETLRADAGDGKALLAGLSVARSIGGTLRVELGMQTPPQRAAPRPRGGLSSFEGVQLPEGALPTNVLPTIPIGDHHYVMLNDFMELFDLREDYCFAIVAQNLQEDGSIIDLVNYTANDKYSIMDAYVTTGEFIEPIKALAMICKDATTCAMTLPMELEFRKVFKRLAIIEMGKISPSMTLASSSSSTNNSTLDLWNAALLEEDENQKTLSRSLGATAIGWSADIVMLLEKEVTVLTFGVGPGIMYGLCSRYFLTHAAYGLACGITDPRQFPQYGKSDLLEQKQLIIQLIEEAPQVEATEETQLLVMDAKDEMRHSKRPRHEEEGPLDKDKRLEYLITFLDG
ncbi:hypothetical protein L7F22_040444 [Adiantum nelumboides]|nr:hypothetical protein [Adiantum nelumboides]